MASSKAGRGNDLCRAACSLNFRGRSSDPKHGVLTRGIQVSTACSHAAIVPVFRKDMLLLTKNYLVLIRAALRFFDEEMGPHGIRVMQPYFDEPLTAEFAKGEIQDLRTRLKNCVIAYVRCDTRTMTLATAEPFLKMDDIGTIDAGQFAEIATILFLVSS